MSIGCKKVKNHIFQQVPPKRFEGFLKISYKKPVPYFGVQVQMKHSDFLALVELCTIEKGFGSMANGAPTILS